MINIGSKQLKGISIGNRAVKAVYKGSQKVWAKESWVNLSLSKTYIAADSYDNDSSTILVPSGTLEGDGAWSSYEWIVEFDVKWKEANWDASYRKLEINGKQTSWDVNGDPFSQVANGTFAHVKKQFIGAADSLIYLKGRDSFIKVYRGSESSKLVAAQWFWNKKSYTSNSNDDLYIKNLSLTYKLVNS